MSIFIINVILLSYIALSFSAFPSHFKKCNRKDADFHQCLINAGNDGIAQLTKAFPALTLPNVDPFEVAVLNIEPGAKGVVALEQKFKDCKTYGISKGTFDKLKFNFDEKTMEVKLTIPDLKMECNYDFDGKVLILPIVGNGRATIDEENMKISFTAKWDETKKNDKTFLKFSAFSGFTMDPDLLKFNFENLFNGDKLLGDNINKVLNENWEAVYADTKSGYEKAYGIIVQEIFNDFFSKISIEEAFD